MAGVEISHIGAEPTHGCDGVYVTPEAWSWHDIFFEKGLEISLIVLMLMCWFLKHVKIQTSEPKTFSRFLIPERG